MLKAGNKRPLRENPGENSSDHRAKRSRFDNIVLLGNNQENGPGPGDANGQHNEAPRRIIRAGKRKKPTCDEESEVISSPSSSSTIRNVPETDENDIISQLTKEFKKARLRPVFFTISTFIEQTVDEVGFTVADEPETEVTVRLNLTKKTVPTTTTTPPSLEREEDESKNSQGIQDCNLSLSLDSKSENIHDIKKLRDLCQCKIDNMLSQDFQKGNQKEGFASQFSSEFVEFKEPLLAFTA